MTVIAVITHPALDNIGEIVSLEYHILHRPAKLSAAGTPAVSPTHAAGSLSSAAAPLGVEWALGLQPRPVQSLVPTSWRHPPTQEEVPQPSQVGRRGDSFSRRNGLPSHVSRVCMFAPASCRGAERPLAGGAGPCEGAGTGKTVNAERCIAPRGPPLFSLIQHPALALEEHRLFARQIPV